MLSSSNPFQDLYASTMLALFQTQAQASGLQLSSRAGGVHGSSFQTGSQTAEILDGPKQLDLSFWPATFPIGSKKLSCQALG